jgi:peptide/nickel transport system permease protein
VLRALTHRVPTAIVTLVLVTFLVFGLIHLAPGDPLDTEREDGGPSRISAQARAELRALYRLDLPLHRQYGLWLWDVASGDLGRSFHDRRPVLTKIGERAGITVLLNGLALTVMVLLSVPLGALGALRPGSATDRGSGIMA